MCGMMAEFMKEIGKITKCTERASSNGKTAENMWVNTSKILNKGMVNFIGWTEEYTKGSGAMENSTEGVFIRLEMMPLEQDNG